MDNLEKYIKEHRNEFDSEEPSKKVWEGIKRDMPEIKSTGHPIGNWAWKAAAVVFLVTTSYLAFDKWAKPDQILLAEEQYSFGDEFDSAEEYYLRQIDNLQSQLGHYSQEELVNQEFMLDLQKLDSMYTGLKQEFAYGGNSEMIADALIQNLRIRMEIINQQLKILEKVKIQTGHEDVEI